MHNIKSYIKPVLMMMDIDLKIYFITLVLSLFVVKRRSISKLLIFIKSEI